MFEVRKPVIVVRIKKEPGETGEKNFSARHLRPRNCVTGELLTLTWINGKNKHSLGFFFFSKAGTICADTHILRHTLLQWSAFSMVVTLSHNPPGKNLLFQFVKPVFLHIKSESLKIQKHFLVVYGIPSPQSKRRLISEGLRASCDRKSASERERNPLWAVALFLWNVRKKVPRGSAYILKTAPTSATACSMPSVTKQHRYEMLLC